MRASKRVCLSLGVEGAMAIGVLSDSCIGSGGIWGKMVRKSLAVILE